ncbi:MAG: hypothetical protein HY905_28270 [Deltaproteobacteria bacterium]|nr:hypothetical protein [Deltaproteobacteria bacterium]
MKLRGHLIHAVRPGVEVWEAGEFPLPLRLVLQHRLTCAPRPVEVELPMNEPGAETPLQMRDAPVGYLTPEGETRRIGEGLVVSSSLPKLVDFLAEGYVPLADGQLERFLRRAKERGQGPESIRREIEDTLDHVRQPWLPPRLRLGQRTMGGSPVLLFGRNEMPGVRLETDRGEAQFANGPQQVICHDFSVRVDGLRVPRRGWALLSHSPAEPVLFWDGSCMRSVASIAQLPPGFLEAVDRNGSVLAEVPELPVGAPELEPRFLLRVPPAAELARTRERRPAEPALRCAAFLFDSCSPVGLSPRGRRIPVVDDPRTARWVLGRTTRSGIYVPGAPPSPAPVDGRADCVLVGAVPRSV